MKIKIKNFFQRVPLWFKSLLFLGIVVAVISFGVYELLRLISVHLVRTYGIQLSVSELGRLFDLNLLASLAAGVLLMLLIFFGDIFRFVSRIQKALKESLMDRQLVDSLPHFREKGSFDHACKNLASVLSMYKSFDTMKSGRIALEMTTLKTLISNVSKGILLVSQEKVVTHINHVGEQMLKLIPGEIIGQAISRKISHETFLEYLDEGLEYDKKVIEEPIEFKDESVLLSVLPIKDKFGEVVRALVVLGKPDSEVKEEAEEEDPKPKVKKATKASKSTKS